VKHITKLTTIRYGLSRFYQNLLKNSNILALLEDAKGSSRANGNAAYAIFGHVLLVVRLSVPIRTSLIHVTQVL
jgi:hypothetical protein